MEFGHAPDPDRVDLSLPPDDPITATVLRGGPGGRVRAGLPIWNKREWVGEIYPPGTAPNEHLAAFGRIYDTVEVNSTFYAPPSPLLVSDWAATVPADFRFCPKVWKAISHSPSFAPADMLRFLDCALAFGDRLGPVFLQLPPHAGLDAKRTLARLLDAIAPEVRLVVELRHPDWMRDRETRRRLFAHLAERGIGLVITDTAGRRDLVHMGVSAPFTLVRWKGQGLGERDAQRIDDWADRLIAWTGAGLSEVFFVAHEENDHERRVAPLLRRLGARLAAGGVKMARTFEPGPGRQLGLL